MQGSPTTLVGLKVNTILGSKMADLSVEVRHLDIVVTQPGTGHWVTYRRELNSPLLQAVCSMRSDPDLETLRFLAEASKAAYAKASALGWLPASEVD